MGRLKKLFLHQLKASSLTEVLVATTILLVVFAIALVTLNNIMTSSVKKDTGVLENKIEHLIYQYKNKQLKIPVSYTDEAYIISIKNSTQNEIQFIEFSVSNSTSKKTISKKILFYEKE